MPKSPPNQGILKLGIKGVEHWKLGTPNKFYYRANIGEKEELSKIIIK